MSQGVFTEMKRVRFIKETEFISFTEWAGVGPNTPYPVKVTREQLSEILYQVRRSEITGGAIDATTDSGVTVALTSTASPENLVYSSPDGKSSGYRGYSFLNISQSIFNAGVDPLPTNVNSYFENNYSVYQEYIEDNVQVYEAKNEYAIWHPIFAGSYPSILGVFLITGLSNEISVKSIVSSDGLTASPDNYYGFGYSGNSVEIDDSASAGYTTFTVGFYNTAVYRDIDGSGNPFSPLNEIFLGVEVTLTAHIDPEGTFDVLRIRSWDTGFGYEQVVNLNIELKDSTIIIPLFSRETLDSATDLILTAKEWWPYAKGSPPTPVWNFETGAKL